MVASFQIHRNTNGSVKTEVAPRLMINGKRDIEEAPTVDFDTNKTEAKKRVQIQIEMQPLQQDCQ